MTSITPDVLSTVLTRLRLRATVLVQSRFCGTWALDTSGTGKAAFHLVLSGSAWLHLDAQPEPTLLRGGDLVLFPRDAPHVISHDRERTAVINTVKGFGLEEAAPSEGTVLLCGHFEVIDHRGDPLLSALPECLLFPGCQSDSQSFPAVLLRRILEETRASSVAANVVIERLIDVLFIEAIRHHLHSNAEKHGLFAALGEPRLARVLARVHARPEEPWTVESLAEIGGMSRSAFAQLFHDVVGESPVKYVSRCRIQAAVPMLREELCTVLEIAMRLGYQTEAAFARAFKRELGVTPGAVRRGR